MAEKKGKPAAVLHAKAKGEESAAKLPAARGAELRSERIDTVVDRLCAALAGAHERALSMPQLASAIGISAADVERIGKVLQEYGIVELSYPMNVFTSPVLKLKETLEPEMEKPMAGNVLAAYPLQLPHGRLWAAVSDEHREMRPVYNLFLPRIGPYTLAYLDHMKDELARMVPVQSEEITDPRLSQKLRERFHLAATDLVERELPNTDEKGKRILSDHLLYDMYGLGDIELLMLDDWLEEIALNGAANPISVYHRKFGWLKTNLRIPSEEDIYNFASQIGRKAGREITLLSPIMDAYLTSGDRVSATLFPISTQGDTITIRRFARNPWTVIDFIDERLNTMSSEMAAFLWLSIQYEMNILVIGGTASGKTSTLNTLCHLLPPSQRVITIEDTRELSMPSYLKWNWIPLTTRNPNPEGKGGVGMLELMVSSLRMRPDRIILGEVRRRREAEVLFEAMHTGHAAYSTVHADNAPQLIRRLTNRPIELPATELEALHLIVVQYRDRRKGVRRMHEIAEVTTGAAQEVALNTVYRWHPRTDEFEKVNDSLRVMEELNLHTGMTVGEVRSNIAEKKDILEWMGKHNWRDVDKVGALVGLYYKSPAEVLAAVKKDASPEELLG